MTPRATLRMGMFVALQITAVIGAGWWIVPRALDAWEWASAKDDSVALTDLGLKATLAPALLQSELDVALGADDVDLAASLIKLAEQQRLDVPASLRDRYDAATAPSELVRRGNSGFLQRRCRRRSDRRRRPRGHRHTRPCRHW